MTVNPLIVPTNSSNSTAIRPPRRFWRIVRRILLGLLAFIVILAILGAIYQSVASNNDRIAHPPVGKLISVGDYALHLYCTGQGSPTVILISGAGNNYAVWDRVQTPVSTTTRVCSYDRAGTGWSDYPSTQPTLASHVRDLHTLLQNSGEPGPYILVGHSIGGIEARMYYNAYPQDVRGMVFVDSAIEGEYQHLPSFIASSNAAAGTFYTICQILSPFGVIRLTGFGAASANSFTGYSDTAKAAIEATFNRTENCKGLAWEGALESVLDSGSPTSMNNLPIFVLTAGLTDVEANPGAKFSATQIQQFQEFEKDWLTLQAQFVMLSTNSKQVIADKSSHFIQSTQPDLVISAIQDVIKRSQPQQ